MAYSAIAYIAPNYRDFKNYWLKAYEPGTTTPKSMALDSSGLTLVAKLQLNEDGFLKTAGNALVIPYIEGSYDLWLFPTEAEADANDTSNAEILADDINSTNVSLINDLSQTYNFDTVAQYKAFATLFPAGKKIYLLDRDAEFTVISGTGTGNNIDIIASSTVNQSISISKIESVVQLGGLPDGATDITPIVDRAAVIMGANQLDFPYGASGYVINTPVSIANLTCVFNGDNQLIGTATLSDVNGILVKNGAYQGYIFSPELRGKQIEVIAGTIRQQQPSAVSGITRPAGTTAIVNKVAHGRAVGDYVVIQGATPTGYNGTHEVAQVDDADNYRIVVDSGLATPATGSITEFGADWWDWIKDSTHEPIGVDDSQPVRSDASGYGLLVPFTKTYSRVLSMSVEPDETISGAQGMVIGPSISTNAMAIRANLNKTVAGRVLWNGSAWQVNMGTDQGEIYTNNSPHPFGDIDYTGGNLTFNHSFCLGSDITITPDTASGTVVPYIPARKSNTDSEVVVNFLYVNAGALDLYTGAEVTNLSFHFSKNSNRLIKFDGSDRSSETKMYFGNIWFFGIMEV